MHAALSGSIPKRIVIQLSRRLIRQKLQIEVELRGRSLSHGAGNRKNLLSIIVQGSEQEHAMPVGLRCTVILHVGLGSRKSAGSIPESVGSQLESFPPTTIWAHSALSATY